jgi:hypothetical protein
MIGLGSGLFLSVQGGGELFVFEQDRSPPDSGHVGSGQRQRREGQNAHHQEGDGEGEVFDLGHGISSLMMWSPVALLSAGAVPNPESGGFLRFLLNPAP